MNAVTLENSYGTPPKFLWLPLDSLVVDERYQRRITEDGRRQVRIIAAGFSWSKFQALLVSGPDRLGDYAVLDGQHRLEAARLCEGIDKVPCLIVEAPDVSSQAATFKGVNKDRTRVTRINIFWADVAAGDEKAVAVKRVCDDCGVIISRVGTGRQKPLHTVAVAALDACLKLDEGSLRKALQTLVAAQAEADNAFRAGTIKALTRLYAMNPGRVDDERLVKALADMDLDDMITEALSGAKTFGGKAEIVLQMLLTRAYNKNLGGDRRLEEPRV